MMPSVLRKITSIDCIFQSALCILGQSYLYPMLVQFPSLPFFSSIPVSSLWSHSCTCLWTNKDRLLERKQKSSGFVIWGARGRTEKGFFFDAVTVCIFISGSMGCCQVESESCIHAFFTVHSEFLSGGALGYT